MRRVAVVTAVLLAGIMACGGGEEGPPADDLVGTWQATKDEYVAVSGGASVDLIAAGGSGVLVLNEDHSGTFTLTPAGGSTEVRAFTWSQDGEKLTWTYGPGNDDNFDVSLGGGVLTLRKSGPKSFDCDGDGTQEPANWTMEFSR